MRSYEYRCHDHSLLTPTFKKWMVTPLIRFVPWVIPANIVTIFSNLFVYIALFLSMYWNGPMGRLLIGTSLIIYLVGDHLDGMQAKRTKTSSALGEFCDHYLDAFNNGVILFTVMIVFEVADPILVVVVLVSSYLAHTSIFYEQLKTGWLTFEKIGSLEGVLILSILIGISGIEVIYDLLMITIFKDYRLVDMLLLLSALGGLFTFYTTSYRTPTKGRQFWIFIFGLTLTGIFSYAFFSTMECFVLITLYASLYLGYIMRGHLVDGIERLPDLGTPLLLILVWTVPNFTLQSVFVILIIYLSIRIVILIISTFYSLKSFWVWSNPQL